MDINIIETVHQFIDVRHIVIVHQFVKHVIIEIVHQIVDVSNFILKLDINVFVML